MTTVHGPNWDDSKPIREQAEWSAHASFMDALVDEGFVVLGGPLDDGEHALLVVDAADEDEVRERLGGDPWAPTDILAIGTVRRWSIWLDARTPSSPS